MTGPELYSGSRTHAVGSWSRSPAPARPSRTRSPARRSSAGRRRSPPGSSPPRGGHVWPWSAACTRWSSRTGGSTTPAPSWLSPTRSDPRRGWRPHDVRPLLGHGGEELRHAQADVTDLSRIVGVLAGFHAERGVAAGELLGDVGHRPLDVRDRVRPVEGGAGAADELELGDV